MPKTPDRFPGTREEDEIQYIDQGDVDPLEEGGTLYANGGFRFRDSVGVYDPRSGGSRVGLLIFKVDGGLVYDSNGHPQLKVSE